MSMKFNNCDIFEHFEQVLYFLSAHTCSVVSIYTLSAAHLKNAKKKDHMENACHIRFCEHRSLQTYKIFIKRQHLALFHIL